MKYNYNDGGRSKYFKGQVGDCVCRAVAIATGKDYKEVYKEISKLIGYTPRNSVKKKDTKKIMEHYGFTWVSCMGIGTGCTTHLRESELPKGTIICQVTGHVTTVIDGVINDNHDPSRNGSRCVYGYWEVK